MAPICDRQVVELWYVPGRLSGCRLLYLVKPERCENSGLSVKKTVSNKAGNLALVLVTLQL